MIPFLIIGLFWLVSAATFGVGCWSFPIFAPIGRTTTMVPAHRQGSQEVTATRSVPTSLRALPPFLEQEPLDSLVTQYLSPLYDEIATRPIVVGGGILLSAAALAAAVTSPPSQLINTATLEAIVAGTYLDRSKTRQQVDFPLECIYKASKDGWSAIAFHNAVDERGSALVVARSRNGKVFGGYNPNGWRSTDDYYNSASAFLWCLRNRNGNNNNTPQDIIKLPVLVGGNCAVFDYATAGPCFGSCDLRVGPPQAAVMGGFAGPDAEDLESSAGNLRNCQSSVGSAFANDRAWPIRGTATLVDVEVYAAKL